MVLVVASDDHRVARPSRRAPLDEHLERRVLLLDDDHLGEPVGELAHLSSSSGTGIDNWNSRMPAAQRLVVGEPEQAQRLAHLVVGVPAGGDADPVVGGADGDPVERLSTPYWRASSERTCWNSRSMSSV